MTPEATQKRSLELGIWGWTLLVLLMLTGCGGSTSDTDTGWTHYLGDAGRAGVADAGPTGQPVELWRFQGPCDQPPIVVGETAFAACRDGLYALSVTDGTESWRFDSDQPFGGGIAAADGLVYASEVGGTLYAFDIATGDEVWRVDARVVTAPAVAGGLLTVGTWDGVLIAADAETGDEQWRYQVTDAGELRNTAMANGRVYIGSTGAGLTAVDAETGELAWQADTSGPTGSVRVIDGIAYTGSSGYSGPDGDGYTTPLSAFDAETGDLLWQREPLFPPAVLNSVGYSGSLEGDVYAFDTNDGSELWHVEAGRVTQAPIVTGDVVYVLSDGDEMVYALDGVTGDQMWRFEVVGAQATIAVTDKRLFVVAEQGEVYAIGDSDA